MNSMNLIKRWKMRSLKHYAIKTGMTCRYSGANIEGYDRQLRGWVIVFNGTCS